MSEETTDFSCPAIVEHVCSTDNYDLVVGLTGTGDRIYKVINSNWGVEEYADYVLVHCVRFQREAEAALLECKIVNKQGLLEEGNDCLH